MMITDHLRTLARETISVETGRPTLIDCFVNGDFAMITHNFAVVPASNTEQSIDLKLLRQQMRDALEQTTGSPVKNHHKIDAALSTFLGYNNAHEMTRALKPTTHAPQTDSTDIPFEYDVFSSLIISDNKYTVFGGGRFDVMTSLTFGERCLAEHLNREWHFVSKYETQGVLPLTQYTVTLESHTFDIVVEYLRDRDVLALNLRFVLIDNGASGSEREALERNAHLEVLDALSNKQRIDVLSLVYLATVPITALKPEPTLGAHWTPTLHDWICKLTDKLDGNTAILSVDNDALSALKPSRHTQSYNRRRLYPRSYWIRRDELDP